MHQDLVRIGGVFKVEAELNGRRRMRQARTAPMLTELKVWMNETWAQVPAKSPMALAIAYSLRNRTALTHFVGDGRIDALNNTPERALRCVAIGRKNCLHDGSDAGGNTAAVIYTLPGPAKLNRINLQRCLRYVLDRIADHRSKRNDELLPWAVADKLTETTDAQALRMAA